MSSSSEPRILRIELEPGLPTVNINKRPAMRRARDGRRVPSNAKDIERLRDEAAKEAKALAWFPFSRCRIRCIFRAPDNRKRDVINLFPSFKAMIDGLVLAGVIKDDNDFIVKEVSIVRGPNRDDKKSQLIIQVIEDV